MEFRPTNLCEIARRVSVAASRRGGAGLAFTFDELIAMRLRCSPDAGRLSSHNQSDLKRNQVHPERRRVVIRLEMAGDMVLGSRQGTGHGISAERSRISSSSFPQGEIGRSRNSGLGLGLRSSRSWLRNTVAHPVNEWKVSEGVRNFTVTLPLTDRKRRVAAEVLRSIGTTLSHGRYKILVVRR